MKILFVHPNFPGQWRSIAPALALLGHEVSGLGKASHPSPTLPGVVQHGYKDNPFAQAESVFSPLQSFAAAVRQGRAVGDFCLRLKAEGYEPDVLVGHPGWGDMMFVKEVWPKTRIIAYLEYYYGNENEDLRFDPEFNFVSAEREYIRLRNLNQVMAHEIADANITATEWQKSLFPGSMRQRIEVIHEGVDTGVVKPDPGVELQLPDGRKLTRAIPVLTYCARNLEPYRGFHVFMRALPAIQKRLPGLFTIVVGGDDVSYGRKPSRFPTWREEAMAESGGEIDGDLVWFAGKLPFPEYVKVLQVSAVHAYLTYPFVPSWSLLEAAAAGCRIVASDVAPVREVLAELEDVALVPFHDVDAIAQAVVRCASEGHVDGGEIGARQRKFDVSRHAVPSYVKLMERIAEIAS